MSMYNLMFGKNPLSELLLATLGLTTADVGRFRDCFVSEGKIAVYTRNGGNNRPDYMPDALVVHPNYLYDQDDDFDNTYATIYFSFPEEFKEDLKKLDSKEKFDPDARWLKRLEDLKNDGS